MKLLWKIGIVMLLAIIVSSTTISGESFAKQTKKNIAKVDQSTEMIKALNKLKELIPELKQLDLVYSETIPSNDSGPERWEYQLRSKNNKISSTLTIDTNTKLLFDYRIHNNNWITSKLPTKQFAIQKADSFLETIFGDAASYYRFKEVIIPDQENEHSEKGVVYVIYELFINDIYVRDFNLNVTVDGKGHIIDLDNWAADSLIPDNFPSKEKVISLSKANKEISKMLRMTPVYDLAKNDGSTSRKIVVYEPQLDSGAIDAVTGKISKDIANWMDDKPLLQKVKGKGEKLVARTPEEAADLVENVFGYSLEDFNYVEEDFNHGVYQSFRWKSKQTDEKFYLSVIRETGELNDFTYYTEFPYIEKPAVTEKEARKIAFATLEQYVPVTTKEIFLTSSDSPYDTYKDVAPDWVENPEQYKEPDYGVNYYSFQYNDAYQGVKVTSSLYHISIDPATGKVVSFYFNRKDLSEYPDKGKLISPTSAANTYLKHNPLVLNYVWPVFFGQKKSKPVLLYTFEPQEQAVINAVTGEYIFYNEIDYPKNR